MCGRRSPVHAAFPGAKGIEPAPITGCIMSDTGQYQQAPGDRSSRLPCLWSCSVCCLHIYLFILSLIVESMTRPLSPLTPSARSRPLPPAPQAFPTLLPVSRVVHMHISSLVDPWPAYVHTSHQQSSRGLRAKPRKALQPEILVTSVGQFGWK